MTRPRRQSARDARKVSDRMRALALASAFAAFLALPVAGCVTTNPATGGQDFTPFMSPAEESRIGAEEHPKMIAQFGGVYDDVEIGAYVAEIGGRLAQNSELAGHPFRFTVLNSPEVNAFALPGGYVYVTRGLLALANSEAELAGVLAHEIGHVTARHTAQRYNRAVGVGLATSVLGALVRNDVFDQLAGLGSELYLKGYSRDQEYESDVLGVRYMARAGYDPRAQSAFLRSLELHSELEKHLAGSERRDPVEDFFATHPRTAERVLRAIEAADRADAVPDATRRRDRYLQTIDGLLYGDDPEQGLVRGQTFVHPHLRFTFAVPQGYRIINSERAVVARGPDGAVIKFDAATKETAADMASYLSQTWGRGLALSDVESITINGMEAATARASARVSGRPAILRLVAIRFSPREIYRFLMVTPAGIEPTLREDLRRTTYSFQRLSDAEAERWRPYSVLVITVQPGDTVSTIAARLPIADFQEPRFRALNGLSPEEGVIPGQQVKVIAE
jgi:predicted Zn-dependent protease